MVPRFTLEAWRDIARPSWRATCSSACFPPKTLASALTFFKSSCTRSASACSTSSLSTAKLRSESASFPSATIWYGPVGARSSYMCTMLVPRPPSPLSTLLANFAISHDPSAGLASCTPVLCSCCSCSAAAGAASPRGARAFLDATWLTLDSRSLMMASCARTSACSAASCSLEALATFSIAASTLSSSFAPSSFAAASSSLCSSAFSSSCFGCATLSLSNPSIPGYCELDGAAVTGRPYGSTMTRPDASPSSGTGRFESCCVAAGS
mmetsp:Transcript_64406/g.151655  ORF Transcript_64406/g.151655 Transcript_64406/m.151655 type:complete len:267 (-) Transcript_64406:1302-2102(-)